jgi:hypothetical protein
MMKQDKELADLLSERQFEQQIKDLAKLFNRCYYHTHRSQFSPAGFPDCIIASTERKPLLIAAELKVGKNQPTFEQYCWIRFFQFLGQVTDGLVDGFLWYPEDIEEFARVIQGEDYEEAHQ